MSGSNPVSKVILIKASKVVLSSSNFRSVILRTARTQSSRFYFKPQVQESMDSERATFGLQVFSMVSQIGGEVKKFS